LLSGELGSLAELAIGTQNEAWFHGLYQLRGSSEESFDTFCKTISAMILNELLKSGLGSSRSATMSLEKWCESNLLNSSMSSRMYQYLVDDNFDNLSRLTFQNQRMLDGIKGSTSRVGAVAIAIVLMDFIPVELYKFIIEKQAMPARLALQDKKNLDERPTRYEVSTVGRKKSDIPSESRHLEIDP
jgi:hypothetical protein